MKKVIMIEEVELNKLIKNAKMAEYLLSDVLNSMIKNAKIENMGNNSDSVFLKLQSVKIVIDNINDILNQEI